MLHLPGLDNPLELIQFVGSACQVGTAMIAAGIAVVTFRYTKRRSALALINHNNALANLVNSTVIQSEHARQTLGKLHDCIVGCPDDAVLFMYLNYVHNTYRMRQIGTVSEQVWQDTLSACAGMVARLRRDQVTRLLARGYEARFQQAVLACYDAQVPVLAEQSAVVTRLEPRTRKQQSPLAPAV